MKQKLKLQKLAVIPKITERLKYYKNNMPLRPIVSKCYGPAYFLEKKTYVPF